MTEAKLVSQFTGDGNPYREWRAGIANREHHIIISLVRSNETGRVSCQYPFSHFDTLVINLYTS